MQAIKRKTRNEIATIVSSIEVSQLNEYGKLVANAINTIPQLNSIKSVGLYLNMPTGELPTGYLLKNCFDKNLNVYLPRVENLKTHNDNSRFNKQWGCLHFIKSNSWNDVLNYTPRGRYNLREPPYEISNDLLLSSNPSLDVLFLPGVAFTPSGRRLGHGAGFYDDFLARYRLLNNNKLPILVGVSLPHQILFDSEKIPLEEHDVLLDYVVAGDKVYSCKDYTTV